MTSDQKTVDRLLKQVTSDPAPDDNGEEKVFHCPFCHHHKRKLGVVSEIGSDRFGWWHCWVCDTGGKSLSYLFYKLDADDSSLRQIREIEGEPTRKQKTNSTEKLRSYVFGEQEKQQTSSPSLELPETWKPLWKASGAVAKRAVKHLKSRGLGNHEIWKYNLGVVEKGKFGGRLLIPSYEKPRKLNYFVARRLFEGQNVKYLNPSVQRSKVVPFNSLLDFSMPVIVVEGMFDAMAVGFNAVPLLGGQMPGPLRARLLSCPHVHVMLDHDAKTKGKELALSFLDEGTPASFVEMPEGADPSELGRARCWDRIKNHGTSSIDRTRIHFSKHELA